MSVHASHGPRDGRPGHRYRRCSPSQIPSKPRSSIARAMSRSSGQRTSRSTSGSWTPTRIGRVMAGSPSSRVVVPRRHCLRRPRPTSRRPTLPVRRQVTTTAGSARSSARSTLGRRLGTIRRQNPPASSVDPRLDGRDVSRAMSAGRAHLDTPGICHRSGQIERCRRGSSIWQGSPRGGSTVGRRPARRACSGAGHLDEDVPVCGNETDIGSVGDVFVRAPVRRSASPSTSGAARPALPGGAPWLTVASAANAPSAATP